MSRPSLFVSCAEPSGDRLAAPVVKALRARVPNLRVFGSVGPALRAQGADATVHMEELSVMGVSAVLARLPAVLRARARLRAALDSGPTVALFVDGPSLHLPLARSARRAGIATVGLVCPQVWAWKAERVSAIARAYETTLCLFDFEPPLLAAACAVHGSRAIHIGHPVLDRLPPADLRQPSPHPLFGLTPGSRQQELDRHLGPFLDTARAVRTRLPQARFLLAGHRLPSAPEWLTCVDHIHDLQPCHAVLSKSGTVTLELAHMGVPMVVAHDASFLTRAVGRLLIQHVSHIALPNVLCRRAVVPEQIGRPNPERLADDLLRQRGTPPIALPSLGTVGATDRIVQHLWTTLQRAGSQPRAFRPAQVAHP